MKYRRGHVLCCRTVSPQIHSLQAESKQSENALFVISGAKTPIHKSTFAHFPFSLNQNSFRRIINCSVLFGGLAFAVGGGPVVPGGHTAPIAVLVALGRRVGGVVGGGVIGSGGGGRRRGEADGGGGGGRWGARGNEVGAESVHVSEILAVVDVVLEEHLLHLEEGLPGEEAVTAGLMLGADSPHFEFVGELLEAALQILARLHQVLDIVHVREVELQVFKECFLCLGKVLKRIDDERAAFDLENG